MSALAAHRLLTHSPCSVHPVRDAHVHDHRRIQRIPFCDLPLLSPKTSSSVIIKLRHRAVMRARIRLSLRDGSSVYSSTPSTTRWRSSSIFPRLEHFSHSPRSEDCRAATGGALMQHCSNIWGRAATLRKSTRSKGCWQSTVSATCIRKQPGNALAPGVHPRAGLQ